MVRVIYMIHNDRKLMFNVNFVCYGHVNHAITFIIYASIGQFDIEIIGLNPRLPWTMTVEGVIYHTLYDDSSYMVTGS
jgi:hypothetical protein